MSGETVSKTTASNVGNLGTGLQVAGILARTVGAYDQSSLAKTGYEYQSKVATANAGIAEQQRSDALLRGQVQENRVRQAGAQTHGQAVADMAARNIDMSGSGSALDILNGIDLGTQVAALTARDNAAKEAWGHSVEASNARGNASFLDWRASRQNPLMDAAGTLLGGAGTVASSWYTLRNGTAGAPAAVV